MHRATDRQDDFDTVLLSELTDLRESERRLDLLYRQLREEPHLWLSFLSELSHVKQRTERLFAVLSPLEFSALSAASNGYPSAN